MLNVTDVAIVRFMTFT